MIAARERWGEQHELAARVDFLGGNNLALVKQFNPGGTGGASRHDGLAAR